MLIAVDNRFDVACDFCETKLSQITDQTYDNVATAAVMAMQFDWVFGTNRNQCQICAVLYGKLVA